MCESDGGKEDNSRIGRGELLPFDRRYRVLSLPRSSKKKKIKEEDENGGDREAEGEGPAVDEGDGEAGDEAE